MAPNRRLTLIALAAVALMPLLEKALAAPGGAGFSAIQEVRIDYPNGRLTIVGVGLHDGRTKPRVTLGGHSLGNVTIVDDSTISGDIDLRASFPLPGAYQLVIDPEFESSQTASLMLNLDSKSTAGQVCPHGSYVVGFDPKGNILCSGNTTVPAAAVAGSAAAAEVSPPQAATTVSAGTPVIDDIEPSSIVYGTRETTITIVGSGFKAETVVTVAGQRYKPSVSDDGRRLEITVATRELIIGVYPITVANGPGMEARRKRGLVIY